MKLDLEGHDEAALAAFFAQAQPSLYPDLLIVEISGDNGARIAALAARHDYRRAGSTRTNAIFARAASGTA
jgi:hypothetical protein